VTIHNLNAVVISNTVSQIVNLLTDMEYSFLLKKKCVYCCCLLSGFYLYSKVSSDLCILCDKLFLIRGPSLS